MKFGIEKCAMLIMKSEERETIEGIELQNQKSVRRIGERENDKYLGICEADTIKQTGMQEKVGKDYFRTTWKLLKTKFCSRNLIRQINTWAVSLVRYSRPFFKWTRVELKQMDQRSRKLMMIHKVSHLIDDIDRLYMSRKEVEVDLPALRIA